jgi:hypothetical protein
MEVWAIFDWTKPGRLGMDPASNAKIIVPAKALTIGQSANATEEWAEALASAKVVSRRSLCITIRDKVLWRIWEKPQTLRQGLARVSLVGWKGPEVMVKRPLNERINDLYLYTLRREPRQSRASTCRTHRSSSGLRVDRSRR